MDTDIKMSVKATDTKAQYDNKAKQLLGHKIILAHILVMLGSRKLLLLPIFSEQHNSSCNRESRRGLERQRK